MDKPRHPLVIQPWKIQQSQRTKWSAQLGKTGKQRGQPSSKTPKILTPKQTRKMGSKKAV